MIIVLVNQLCLSFCFGDLVVNQSLITTWGALDCSTIVDFSIGKKNYRVKRYKDMISLKEDNLPYIEYSKITGEYSKKFAEIVGFKALLPKRKSGTLEVPPPAYYFIPFYIDQKRSWAKTWDNFNKLEQYDSWKSTIIKYHIGLLTPEHFEIESEKGEKKESQKTINKEVEKINTVLEVLDIYVPVLNLTAINQEKLNQLTNEIIIDLSQLQEKQELMLDKYALLQSEKIYLEQQRKMTEKIILELDKDYIFSIEHLIEDEIECPLCGTIHENSVISRSSIMTDKIQAENQFATLVSETDKLEIKLLKLTDNLDEVRNKINDINNKYVIEETNKNINFDEIVKNISGKVIKENVIKDKNGKIIQIASINKEIKSLTKEQKGLITKEQIEENNEDFNQLFSKFIRLLDAKAVNISSINSPLDYNKIVKEGGAAEGARAILAYYLTIFTMVEKFGNEVRSPLVIDTPNQQEQSFTNYEKIVSILLNNIDQSNQVILCAMENDQLKNFKQIANVITLDSKKILDSSKYDIVRLEFEKI